MSKSKVSAVNFWRTAGMSGVARGDIDVPFFRTQADIETEALMVLNCVHCRMFRRCQALREKGASRVPDTCLNRQLYELLRPQRRWP